MLVEVVNFDLIQNNKKKKDSNCFEPEPGKVYESFRLVLVGENKKT